MPHLTRLTPVFLLFSGACAEEHEHEHERDPGHGAATTVVMNFTPLGGGETLSFRWMNEAADEDALVDDIHLPDGSDHSHHHEETYRVELEVWRNLEDSPVNATPGIEQASGAYQFFFTGSAVRGPAMGPNPSALVRHTYDDTDDQGLPVGLSNRFRTLAWGTGGLTVTLRRFEGGEAKVAGLAEDVASDGFGAIGGVDDFQVTFPVEVR